MGTDTEPHKQMLRRICMLGRVAGWAMIALGVLGVPSAAYAVLVAHIDIGVRGILNGGLDIFGQILTGLLVLVTVQFIRFAVEEATEPGWLLHKGHFILFFFALFLLATWGERNLHGLWYQYRMFHGHMIPMGRPLGIALVTIVYVLPIFTKVLCVLGIAAILRSVLPIMAESKTLA